MFNSSKWKRYTGVGNALLEKNMQKSVRHFTVVLKVGARDAGYGRPGIKPLSVWAGGMAPRVGFEPTTSRLTAGCSTTELPRNIGLRLWRIARGVPISSFASETTRDRHRSAADVLRYPMKGRCYRPSQTSLWPARGRVAQFKAAARLAWDRVCPWRHICDSAGIGPLDDPGGYFHLVHRFAAGAAVSAPDYRLVWPLTVAPAPGGPVTKMG